MTTPVQRKEGREIDQGNGQLNRLGAGLRDDQQLDKRYGTGESNDTRRTLNTIGDKAYARDKKAAELKERLRHINSSPRQKADAEKKLRKIEQAKQRERDNQITGRSGRYSSSDIRTDSNGFLRIKY